MKVSLCHLHSIFPHTYLYIRQGSFTKNVSWGIVIISSCLLLIGSCLWLLSGNGKRDWLKAVNWSSYYCHMKTRTCRKRNRHRDTDRDTQPCLFQRNVNEPTSTSCDQDPPPSPYLLWQHDTERDVEGPSSDTEDCQVTSVLPVSQIFCMAMKHSHYFPLKASRICFYVFSM